MQRTRRVALSLWHNEDVSGRKHAKKLQERKGLGNYRRGASRGQAATRMQNTDIPSQLWNLESHASEQRREPNGRPCRHRVSPVRYRRPIWVAMFYIHTTVLSSPFFLVRKVYRIRSLLPLCKWTQEIISLASFLSALKAIKGGWTIHSLFCESKRC